MTAEPRTRTMTPAIRARSLMVHANAHGWECETLPTTAEGVTDGVYLCGTRSLGGIVYGFAMAWGISTDTHRVVSLSLDGHPSRRFAMTILGTRTEWTGRACDARGALADPVWFTGGYHPGC